MNKLLNLRDKLGLTQTEFARMVGVSRITVSRWENMKFRPNPLAIKALWRLTENVPHSACNSVSTKTTAMEQRQVKGWVISTATLAPEQEKVPPAALNHMMDSSLSDNLKRTEILRKSQIFANLDNQYLVEISKLAHERHLKAHEFLFLAGDPVEYCYLVVSGMVKILKHSPSGTDLITSIFGPGEVLGSILLFAGKIQVSSAQTIGETNVLVVRNSDFISFLKKHPWLSARICQELLMVAGQRIQAAMVRLSEQVGERTDYRLARVLFGLCIRLGPSIPFTRREIAEMTGTTTETTARFISRLTQTGIVQSRRGKVIVIDQSKLRQLAEAS